MANCIGTGVIWYCEKNACAPLSTFKSLPALFIPVQTFIMHPSSSSPLLAKVIIAKALILSLLLTGICDYCSAAVTTTTTTDNKNDAAVSPSELSLTSIDTGRFATAVCNDGSPYKFYDGGNRSSPNIIIYVSLGGYADSDDRMSFRDFRYKTSSTLPAVVDGFTILSVDPVENPSFHNWRHILLPYCSSDLWLGDVPATANQNNGSSSSTNNNKNNSSSNSSPLIRRSYPFRGKAILRAVAQTLVSGGNNNSASPTPTSVVLAGASAGGIGILNFAAEFEQLLKNVTAGAAAVLTLVVVVVVVGVGIVAAHP